MFSLDILSTMRMMVAVSSISAAMRGMAEEPLQLAAVPAPVSGDDLIAARHSRGRTMAGTSTPYCRMLSAVSCMASSSRTLEGGGWGKSCSSDSG